MSILTEAEARKKWCPFAKAAILNFGPREIEFQANRFISTRNAAGERDLHATHTPCIASDCMAWRKCGPAWSEIEAKIHAGHKGSVDEIRAEFPPSGYCGLAGEPTL